ncbi:MAG: Asp-tRNA(Asn)/Glu-tRNA(Gln) amidotransferase subunit GatC [Hydrogenophilales bacterium]
MIENKKILKIASLARLKISEDSINLLGNEFNNILKLIDQIDNLDTSDTLPICHPLENLTSYSTVDSKHVSVTNKTHRNYSPNFKDSYFVVPKIVE